MTGNVLATINAAMPIASSNNDKVDRGNRVKRASVRIDCDCPSALAPPAIWLTRFPSSYRALTVRKTQSARSPPGHRNIFQ